MTPKDYADKDDNHSLLMQALEDSLDERELFVIKKRYELEGQRATLEEISKVLNISRERVRQIESVALLKLKSALKGKIVEFSF